MISVYDRNETDFFHNGIVLSEAIQCTIEEELNGKYVLELIHPIDRQGKWEYLIEENIIKADGQLFRIYSTEKTLDRVYVYARHIFYDLLHNFLEDVRPTNLNGAAALDWILSHTLYPHPFTGTSDIDAINTRYFVRVNPVEAILGEDGLVERWGGELLRDNFTIKLLKQRGQNKGAKIAYGKNLLGLEVKRDMDTVVTRIMPVGRDGILLPEKYVDSSLIGNYVYPRVRVIQFDIGVDDETTEEEAYEKLRQACRELYEKNKIDIPAVNITVNLLLLENTEEYKNLKQLERVELGDIVSCTDNPLKITFEAKVIRVKKDVITNRNVEVELGQYKKGISNTIRDVLKNISEEIKNTTSNLEKAIEDATKLLTNALGGHVLKRPGELLIMDTDDPATAKKVWRWNLNGLGYSDNGINGPYRLAMTMDGQIVADFITTGTLNANLIKTGTLRGRKVEWNLEDGTLLIGNSKQDYNLYYDGNNLSIKLNNKKTIETALTELETGLQDYADQKTQEAIDNIQIGGRNLAPIIDYSHDNQYETVTKTDETFNGQPVYRAIKKTTGTPPTHIGSITIRKGETFTASIWIKHEQQPTMEPARLLFYKSTSLKSVRAKNDYSEWERLVVTYTNNTNADIENVSIYFYPANGVGDVTYFTCPQIERGNKATDWTMPIEDIQKDIQNAENNAKSYTNQKTQEAVDNIQVGGRNLLRNSNELVETDAYLMKSYYLTEDIEEGEIVTISIKGELGEGKERFGLYNSGGHQSGFLTNLYPQDRGEDGVYRKTFAWKKYSANSFINVYQIPSSVSGVTSTIEWIKLEKGNKATDWTPAPEDIQEELDQAAKTETVNELLNNITSQYDQALDNATENILNEVDSRIEEKSVILRQEIISEFELTAEQLQISFTELQEILDGNNTLLNSITTYFSFSDEGFTIGKSDSPFRINLTNEQMTFLENETPVAWINAQRLYITDAQITNSFILGNHIWEKYNDQLTFVRYLG